MKNKKALSGVITVVILIALVVVAAGIIWGVVIPMIKGQLGGAQSCYDASDKITLNKVYTCYNEEGDPLEYTGETQFLINIGDIQVDKIIVSILSQGNSKSFELIDGQAYAFLREASDTSGYLDAIELVKKDSGKSYIINTKAAFFGFGSESGPPESISIAPVVNNERCQTIDSANEIEECGQDIFVG